ncbi:PTS mannose/fructose/sorbose transporter subunit IIB [Photobacterium profundum]|jgi:PTS system mannose-specific IIB component|uniref:PTS mannose/fructose/sorbose transporter subunit IIB n=3 Tax=Photobacterium TaxID=657 RepID=A0A2T3J7K4_9GAMM|nr:MULTISPECIES: PTS sugar transporter subunit IIB [Photobacterium]EAS43166.1 putative PTS system, mannose-specific IIB component [Photobacterium profundum 3TCK]PSU44731.1 PTS mannose/fructose/sorbose transporter subunit IIB [Photobacterium frigidiphilum]PSV49918.1 PTS mannose/fructose/sorbose transporter subunit IIB [Photobacterium indicum]PSV62310.1 PTS mannose/fructose/sorbose transporter subunit IIB [Photobacterium profundum]
MTISFVRIDDRVIHGQLMTRWAKELPCDGIVAIDDAVAADPLLSQVMKGAVTDVKVWLFDADTAISKLPKVIASDKKYFVIAKSPVTLQRISEAGIDLSNLNGKINVGPMSAREGTTTIGNNQSVNPDEVSAFEYLSQLGHQIDFRLVPDASAYNWDTAQKKLNK